MTARLREKFWESGEGHFWREFLGTWTRCREGPASWLQGCWVGGWLWCPLRTTGKIWIVLWFSWSAVILANAQQGLWGWHICWIMSFPFSKPCMASNWNNNGISTSHPAGMTGPCFPPTLTSSQSRPPTPVTPTVQYAPYPVLSESWALFPGFCMCVPLAWECFLLDSLSWKVMLKCHLLKKPSQITHSGSPANSDFPNYYLFFPSLHSQSQERCCHYRCWVIIDWINE